MIRNYFIISLRNLRKHKLLTAINLTGLTVGLASTLIIGLYVHSILTYDQMHSKADQTYMVYKERVTPNGTQPTYDTWIPLKGQLEMDYPQISTATRLAPLDGTVSIGNQSFEEEFQFVDHTFFDVFDFVLANGNNESPFDDLLYPPSITNCPFPLPHHITRFTLTHFNNNNNYISYPIFSS